MKIKRMTRWIMLAVAVMVLAGGVGIVSWGIKNSEEHANAYDGEERYDGGDTGVEYAEAELQNNGINIGTAAGTDASHLMEGLEAAGLRGDLPSRYDARLEYTGVRTKHQNDEAVCWLYSNVTALEYSIAKTYGNYEISNKHMDYLITDGSKVYKQAGATNAYFDKYLNVQGAYRRTDLGTSGNNYEFLYGIMNPLAIVSEKDFTDVMVENDSRLTGINRYEDLWNDEIISPQLRNEILKKNGENYKAYMEKQDYNVVNDPSKVEYIVAGAKTVVYRFDAERTVDSEEVDAIKNLINQYGAVKISSFGTPDRYEHCSYKKTKGSKNMYTFIVDNREIKEDPEDKYSDTITTCTANHGVTIVGWNDDWEYEYNNETRRGAFIIQNSWGPNDDWGESGEDESRWHVAYISDLPQIMYFDQVEKYSDYDDYYGPEDYKDQTIEPATDELIFEFTADNEEKLEAFTWLTVYNPIEFDIYVSATGMRDDFVKDGTATFGFGITKYKFNEDHNIDGNYAIMLKKTDGGAVQDLDKARDAITVMATKIQAPDDPVGPDTPVEPDNPGEEDLPVPSTSGRDSNSAIRKPNAGQNTKNNGMGEIVLYVLPGAFAVLVSGVFIKRRNRSHRKFD